MQRNNNDDEAQEKEPGKGKEVPRERNFLAESCLPQVGHVGGRATTCNKGGRRNANDVSFKKMQYFAQGGPVDFAYSDFLAPAIDLVACITH